MGCDIHLHIEIKIDGQWEHYQAPSISRNYRLFEKMAGVRGDIENAIAPPRGLPADITFVTQYDNDRMGSDGHSHSYLTVKEIAELADWGARNLKPSYDSHWAVWDMEDYFNCYLFGNSFAGFEKLPSDRPEGLEDIRFVFWFDN